MNKKKIVEDKLRERCVWWFVETYLQENEFQYALSKCCHYAYIYHDCDVNENGVLKEPHYHILMHFDFARSGNAVLRDFVGYANTLIEKVNSSPIACYEYLTHLNDPQKYQYNKDRIISHNPVYWENFLPDIRARNDCDLIEDLLHDKEFDLVKYAKRYGRDFVKNWRNYKDFYIEVQWQLRNGATKNE